MWLLAFRLCPDRPALLHFRPGRSSGGTLLLVGGAVSVGAALVLSTQRRRRA